jgi:MFS family permease
MEKVTNWTVWKREKDYQKLFWSGTINGLGNRFSQVATFTLLYQMTGSGMAIGIVLSIRMVPFLLFGPIGGILADRFSKKAILIILDVLRIPFVLALLTVEGAGDVWLVYVSAFFLAVGEAIYVPTRMSSIPAIVKQDRLVHVNAIEQLMIGIILVAGSSSGGVISYLFGLHVPFLLNVVTFAISALLLVRINIPAVQSRHRKKQQPKKQQSEKQQSEKQKTMVWKLIMSTNTLFIFFIIALTMPLANGVDNVLMSVYALEVFRMGNIGVGLIYGSLGLGFVVSSFFSNMLKRGLLILTVLMIAFEGLGHLMLSVAPTFSVAMITVMFITFVGGISNICIDTILMKVVPREKQGTFFGFMSSISNTALGCSMAAAGFLLEVFTPRALSLGVGITYIFFTILYALMFTKINLANDKRDLLRHFFLP